MIYTTREEDVINTDHLVRIEVSATGRHRVARMSDGSSVIVSAEDVEALEKANAPMVAGRAGEVVFVATLWTEKKKTGVHVDTHPVIAWRIEEDAAEPVLARGMFSFEKCVIGVPLPDGKVAVPSERTTLKSRKVFEEVAHQWLRELAGHD
jgi:hypothetical protein